MQTACDPMLFDVAIAEGSRLAAAVCGGASTSHAEAFLLGQTNRARRLTDRFAACFADARMPDVTHRVRSIE